MNEEKAKKIQFSIDSIAGIFTEVVENKKGKRKALEGIYALGYSEFLKRYQLIAYFNEIYDKKTFNCVTGTAFYALLLKELHINYIIKEVPAHVFLVADPYGENIIFESTAKSEGLVETNPKNKNELYNYLYSTSIIDYSEYTNQGYSEVLTQLNQKEHNLTLLDLASLQYLNKGIELFEVEDYESAFSEFQKAYFLSNSNLTNVMLIQTINYISSNYIKNPDSTHIPFLLKLTKISPDENTYDYIIRYSTLFASKISSKKNAPKEFDAFYNQITASIQDSSLLKELIVLRDKFMYIYYSSKMNSKKAREFPIHAYSLEPDNIDVQKQLSAVIFSDFEHFLDNYDESYDDSSALEYIDSLMLNYPFIVDEEGGTAFRVLPWTRDFLRIGYLIEHENLQEAEVTLSNIKKRAKDYPEDLEEMYVKDMFIECFEEISDEYFLTKNYTKAKEVYEQVLEFFPDDEYVLEQIKFIDDYQDSDKVIYKKYNSSDFPPPPPRVK
ncbi:MAG: hypothetical protein K1X55_10880 [Chitinophagales bacterium]|nr:hypothetical protein [Chitinophagales bacterium]